MVDREIMDTGDGGAAAIVAGLLAVALVVVGVFFFVSLNNSATGQTITVQVPATAQNTSFSVKAPTGK
jgi:hypothetical protein